MTVWSARPGSDRGGRDVHEEAIRKADVLIEALGYIRKFHGRFTVIKLGGSVMEDPEALRALLVDVVFMQTVGMRPVVVHGGGKAITHAMEQAGLEARFVQGRRYTDDATLEIVARVLAEEINADIERHINKYGGRASGLHHKTHQCLFGRRLALPGADGRPIDLGRVGEVTEVDVTPIENLCLAGVVPLLPSLAEDDDGAPPERQRRHRRRGRRDGPGGREARLPDRHARASCSTGTNPTACVRESDPRRVPRPDRPGGDRQGDDPQGRGLPDEPGGGGQEDPHHRRPAPPLAPPGDVHRRPGSAPRSS